MGATEGSILSVEGLSVSYRGSSPVLDDLTLSLNTGEIVGLIGETGSGKTTLAKTILGLARAQRGKIRFETNDIASFSARQLRKFRQSGAIQYVFQDPLQSLDPDFTIFDSLVEGLRVRGVTDTTILEEAVSKALAEVHLSSSFANCYPTDISGGQRQRVVIARALINDPTLLILDEPVSALDASNRIKLLRLFKDLSDTRRITQLFISHDLGSVAGISDRVVVLYRGRIVEDGTPGQVLTNPKHPYTQLLVRSAPSIVRPGADRETRKELHEALALID